MEVGDGKKEVKVITRAMKPLIFGMTFVLFFLALYIVFYIVALLWIEVALYLFFSFLILIIELNPTETSRCLIRPCIFGEPRTRGAFHYTKDSGNFSRNSNGKDRFGCF